MNSLALFDINNLYQSCRNKFGGKTDFSKLLSAMRKNTNVIFASGHMVDKNNDCQKFISALSLMGIHLYKWETSNDVAVAIATDVARFVEKVNVIYLCSTDPAFKIVSQYAKNHGVQVIHVGFGFKCPSEGWELDESYLVELKSNVNGIAETTE